MATRNTEWALNCELLLFFLGASQTGDNGLSPADLGACGGSLLLAGFTDMRL